MNYLVEETDDGMIILVVLKNGKMLNVFPLTSTEARMIASHLSSAAERTERMGRVRQ
jgi:hypothetical protein